MNKNKELAQKFFGINLDSSDSSSDGYQTVDDMFRQDFGSNDSSLDSNSDKSKFAPDAHKLKKASEGKIKFFFNKKTGQMVQKSADPKLEKRFREYLEYPMKKAPMDTRRGRTSPDIPQEDRKKLRAREIEHMKNNRSGKRGKIDNEWLKAVKRSQTRKQSENKKKQSENKKLLDELPNIGGSKTRKKCRIFRNNLRKNKISRKYIMLKQCGGGKAKMGSKSKPYSSKRKAMRSRRRVCYYKKKGRTLKMKKKKKKGKSRKKSRRRRRR